MFVRIAPEGIPFVIVGFAILAGLLAFAVAIDGWWWLGGAAWAPFALWVPYFFRDPVRTGDRGPHLAICPADGKVVTIDEVEENDFIRGTAKRVAIFMNVFNVHVNRYPTDGKVAFRHYRKGTFLNATLDKASEHNEKMTLGVECPRGPVLIHQIAGLIARRIVTDHHQGEQVQQGERLGLIRFGSRVEILLPTTTSIRVEVGQHVKAGETVIGEWAT